jgi:ABC-type bacteriocin/lantibiotic exporter with double-glycine peptidase domain
VNAFKRQDPIKFASVKIKNLTFRYNNSLQPVLNNLELEIKKGDFLGIIGHSGSGKSTLVDILIGLLEPESAVRTIDGLETDANNRNWRSLFGYVPQDIYILDENFYSNVAFGEEKNEIDRDRVIDSCKKANLHDFITSGKNGYDASLGERGVKISGGQRQRLGIARALYFDPKILILDEGTSALDEKTEEEILNGLHSLKDSISIIMITHKASTLKFCDKVIELKTTL